MNRLTKEVFQEGCHIHKYKQEAAEQGIKSENDAIVTEKFITLNQALRLFFTDMHVTNYGDFYPVLLQEELI